MVDKITLTGDCPTGKLHVGHYMGLLRGRVVLQNSGKCKRAMVMIADAQALTGNFDNPERIRQNITKMTLGYLSVGLGSEKSILFIQSRVPELTELTFFYSNLVTVARLRRNPTIKNEIKLRSFEADIPIGFFTYLISQAAGITAFKTTTVPVGGDQLPMIKQTREIVRKFNLVYAPVLVEPEALIPSDAASRRLSGTNGKARVSKLLGDYVYLSDDTDTVATHVETMHIDPERLRMSDPGHLEGNTVFTYLEALSRPERFEYYLPEYVSLDELKAHYMRDGLDDVKVERLLTAVIQEELEPIRKRREEYERDIPVVYEILRKGSEQAKEVAAETLHEVKDAIRINYFEDSELTREQTECYRKVAK